MRGSAAGLIFFAVVGVAGEASAHAKLLVSTPAKGSVVTSPAEIRLKFAEPIEIDLSGVEISADAGDKVATGAPATDGTDKATLVVPIGVSLQPGAYRVHWHVVSDDTHKVQGDFTFKVKE